MIAAVSEETRCQYPSKRCDNMRSLKISGELHRFCLFHRCRANDAQRRWTKRKMQEAEAQTTADVAAAGRGESKPSTQRRTKRIHSLAVAVPTPYTRRPPSTIAPLVNPMAVFSHPLQTASDEIFELIDKSLVGVSVPHLETRPPVFPMDSTVSFSALLQHQGFLL